MSDQFDIEALDAKCLIRNFWYLVPIIKDIGFSSINAKSIPYLIHHDILFTLYYTLAAYRMIFDVDKG